MEMDVRNLYKEQFEELREKLEFAYDEESLEAVGAFIEEWTEEDVEEWLEDRISDELVIKSFDGYNFGIDDFWSTAGQYDKYPDKN